MIKLAEIKEGLLHLFFPHVCSGCGGYISEFDTRLCIRCMEAMPETTFEWHANNPVEKVFWGRLPLRAATAQYYYTKESLMQRLVHQVKYKRNRALGVQLGKMMGEKIARSGRFEADALIPLPLFPSRERKRGYNQAALLCEGMAEVMKVPILDKVICRTHPTDTQTRKGRLERWKNIEGKFMLLQPDRIQNKKVLLVDDVITTGATLEACGTELLKAHNVTLSVAVLCYASH